MIGTSIYTAIAVAGSPVPIPGPYWLFTVLHWLTFTLHLTAMNVLFGGLLVFLLAGMSHLRTRLFDSETRLFPTAMAATITLGVAPLLFVQVIYGRFFYSATIISAWNWYLVIPVLIVVYYLLYLVSLSGRLSQRSKLILLAISAAGFVYVSYTFTMISDLAEKPGLWEGLYRLSPGGWSVNPSFVETVFRWLHTLAGALAVAGMSIMFIALYHPGVKIDRNLLTFGGRMYMLGVIKAAVFGIIYLFTLDEPIFHKFMLSPGVHAIIGAAVLNIIAVYVVYRALGQERPHWKVWTSAVLVFAGLFCMVIARHILRLVYLEGQFDPAALTVIPQWSPFAMFFITFLIGLAVLFWMLRKYFGSKAPAE
jgi:hypothetical protein